MGADTVIDYKNEDFEDKLKDFDVVLYSNKDYGCEWDYDFRNKRFYRIDNTRFSVNIIMYALTS